MIIDIIVGAILLISAVISFIRGFIREVLTIFGVVGGLLASYFFGDNASAYIEGAITPEAPNNFEEAPTKLFDLIPYSLASDIVAYAFVFLAVVIVLSVISHFAAESLKKVGLGALDRTFGVIFGLLRGILFLGLLYLPVYMLVEPDTKDRWFQGSRTHPYLENTSGFISHFLPGQDEGTDEKEEELEPGMVRTKTITDELGTRQILDDMDVLKDDIKNSVEEGIDNLESKLKQDGFGYDVDAREEMDQLLNNTVSVEE